MLLAIATRGAASHTFSSAATAAVKAESEREAPVGSAPKSVTRISPATAAFAFALAAQEDGLV